MVVTKLVIRRMMEALVVSSMTKPIMAASSKQAMDGRGLPYGLTCLAGEP